MGDKTPEIKTLGKITSKYLTPCRTFGLKRRTTPKSDIQKKICSDSDNLIVNSSINSPVTPRTCPINPYKNDLSDNLTSVKCKLSSSKLVKLNQNEYQDTPSRSNKHFIAKLKNREEIGGETTPVKSNNNLLVNHKNSRKLTKFEKESVSNEFHHNHLENVENQLIVQIKRINEKYNQLEQLKHKQVYTKKHNLKELQNSTDKWLSAFKEIAFNLQKDLKENGRDCTILDILVDHNISPERVGFNVESLEFE